MVFKPFGTRMDSTDPFCGVIKLITRAKAEDNLQQSIIDESEVESMLQP